MHSVESTNSFECVENVCKNITVFEPPVSRLRDQHAKLPLCKGYTSNRQDIKI